MSLLEKCSELHCVLNGRFYCIKIETDVCSPLVAVDDYDPTGTLDYINECNQLGVIPVSYFMRHITNRDFVMKNHGLGPLGAKAIAKAIEVSMGKTNTIGYYVLF